MNVYNKKFTQIYNQYNGFYHNYAVKQGFSDTSFWILYLLYKGATKYTQQKLAEELCVPQQTINSAVAKLAKEGYVELIQCKGKRQGKLVELTAQGNERCEACVLPLIKAEETSMTKMTDEEVTLLLKLLELHYQYLCEEV